MKQRIEKRRLFSPHPGGDTQRVKGVIKYIALILIMLNTGCLTVNRIKKNCDQFSQVCVTDREVITEIEYCDTTIYIRDSFYFALPPDTVTLTDTLTIINNRAYLPKIRKEKGNIWITALVNASVLQVDGGYIDSTLLVPYRDSVTLQNKTTTTTDTQYIELPPERFVPKFYKFTFWFFLCAVLAGALFVLSRIYSAKLNFILKKLQK